MIIDAKDIYTDIIHSEDLRYSEQQNKQTVLFRKKISTLVEDYIISL